MGIIQAVVRRRVSPLAISGSPPAGQSPLRYPGFVPLVSGGVPPYSFAITAGAVPNGTTFNTSNGAIGTELLIAGSYTATPTIRVRDSALAEAFLPTSIPVFSSTSTMVDRTLATGQQGIAFTQAATLFGAAPFGWPGATSNAFGQIFSPGNGLFNNGDAFDVQCTINTGSAHPSSSAFGAWIAMSSEPAFFLSGPGVFFVSLRRRVDNVSFGGGTIVTIP